MYVNPEGFVALGGHAATVSRVAQRMAQDDWRMVSVWRDEQDEVAALEPAFRERFVGWTGDQLIAIGVWLKAQSKPTTYQHA